MKEQEMLKSPNKVNINKKTFKDMMNNLYIVSDNIDRYFTLPKNLKNNEKGQKQITIKNKKYD